MSNDFEKKEISESGQDIKSLALCLDFGQDGVHFLPSSWYSAGLDLG